MYLNVKTSKIGMSKLYYREFDEIYSQRVWK